MWNLQKDLTRGTMAYLRLAESFRSWQACSEPTGTLLKYVLSYIINHLHVSVASANIIRMHFNITVKI
jgi:hypothetical protein